MAFSDPWGEPETFLRAPPPHSYRQMPWPICIYRCAQMGNGGQQMLSHLRKVHGVHSVLALHARGAEAVT